jgi:hypothetical protein
MCPKRRRDHHTLPPFTKPPSQRAAPRTPRRWHRTRHRRLTPSPGSRTGSDALVEASSCVVVAKEEPSSKRGHGDACASAGPGGVGRRRSLEPLGSPCTRGRAPAFRVRCGRVGVWDRSNRVLLYRLQTNEFFCYFKIIDGVETSYPLVLNDPLATTPKETRLRATHRPKATHA